MTIRRRCRFLSPLAPLLLALAACGGGGAGDGAGTGAGTTPPGTVTVAPPVTDPESASSGADPDALPRADVRRTSEAYAYRRNGPYAAVLARCALVEFDTFEDACTLATLPFVGQDTAEPTVEDVMNRVVVTHDWMGERFEAVLRLREAELLPLLGSITSVVIGSTVRPSYYWPGTGSIRLDPDGLWLSVAEKSNISIEEDFRTEFRAKVGFRNLWEFRKDDQRAIRYFDLEDRTERTLADIEIPTMDLLFHELAHANDFLPPGQAGFLDRSLQPFAALSAIESTWLSPDFAERAPLNSQLLKDLAEVRFTSRETTPELLAVDAATAGNEFAIDGASHFYNYNTIREDFADLYETVAMKRYYDLDLAVAFTDSPADAANFGCDELVVGWGARNRLGDASVAARAKEVTESIDGADPALDAFIATQAGSQIEMTPGLDWCTNLVGGATMATRQRVEEVETVRRSMSHAERHAWVESRQRR